MILGSRSGLFHASSRSPERHRWSSPCTRRICLQHSPSHRRQSGHITTWAFVRLCGVTTSSSFSPGRLSRFPHCWFELASPSETRALPCYFFYHMRQLVCLWLSSMHLKNTFSIFPQAKKMQSMSHQKRQMQFTNLQQLSDNSNTPC